MKHIFLLLSATLAATIHAADWPQWRGPNRDNLCAETGLLQQWPAGGPPLSWKASGVGTGFSSIAVSSGKIFTIGDLGEEAFVMALDFETGKKLWQSRLGAAGGGGGFPGPRATPTVDGKLVYALGQYGDLVCLQVGDGKEVWRKNLQNDFNGKMMSRWGYSESVLVEGDKLICTPGGVDGTVLALNKNTGAVLWRTKELTDSASYASLVPATVNGARQIIVLTDAHVAGISPDKGNVSWLAVRAGKTAVIPTPVCREDFVFVTSGYNVGCNLFKITGNTATQIYANTSMVNQHGGVVLVGESLYGFSDQSGWTCLDFKTGKVLWSEKKLGKGTLLYAEGHLYLRSEGGPGTIALIEATPDGWKEKGRFNQPDRSDKQSWPHLVISQGRLFVRDQDVLLCYDIRRK